MPTLVAGTPEQAGFDPAAITRIRDRAQAWVNEGLTSSLVVLAARRGVIALHEAFGRRAPEPDAPALSVDAVFPVSSLCKPMTATALMMLVEEGLVSLDVPAGRYLPEFLGDGGESITLRHLLTHTAGIAEFDVIAEQIERLKTRPELPPCPDTQHAAIHRILEARRRYRPQRAAGEAMMYTTHGYELIGETVRRVTGRSFPDFMRERLFDPLGMADSDFRLPDRLRVRLLRRRAFANPYGIDLNDERYLGIPWAGGGLKSTALDIARFGQLFLDGGRWGDTRVLSRATVAEMTRNQIPAGVGEEGPWGPSPQGSYGFGWFVIGDRRFPFNGALLPRAAFGHSGMGGTSFWVDPQNEVVGVLLSVWTWPEGVEPIAMVNPPLLSPAPFQDMVTAAVL